MRLLPFFMTFVVAILASGCENASVELAKASAEAELTEAMRIARQAELAEVNFQEAVEQVHGEADGVEAAEEQAAKVAEASVSTKSSLVHEDLDATAWVQTSAEYPSITLQTLSLIHI